MTVKHKYIFVIPAFLFLVAFFLGPLIWNFSLVIQDPEAGLIVYRKLFSDPFYQYAIISTFVLSAIVTFSSLLIGYPIAYYLVRVAGARSGIIIFLLIAPLLTSVVMRAFGWRVLFGRNGLVNYLLTSAGWIDTPVKWLDNEIAAAIGIIHVTVPFMVLAIAASLQSVDPMLEESARVLGASKTRTFLSVTMPLTNDGIATGSILVFMLANGNFVAILLLGGGKLPTLSLLIYQQFNTTRDFLFASAMSNVLLVAAAVCMTLQLYFIRRKGAL